MLKKLTEKEIRTLKMGAIGVVAILILLVVMKGYDSWKMKRDEFAELNNQLNTINIKPAERVRLMSAVPVFEMPMDAINQKSLFRKKLNEQFSDLRINTEPWEELIGNKTVDDYPLIRLKSSGTCTFSQILDLLATLKQNPYLVGIEAMHFECDPQDPQRVEFSITVTTLSEK